jgi:hypothetical protein
LELESTSLMKYTGRYTFCDLSGSSRSTTSAAVGDSHEGPLKNWGESCLKPAKNTERKHTSNLTQNICTRHSPHRGGPRGPPERPNKAPLEQGPPRSRAHAPLERGPPRSRVSTYLERAPPLSRFPHEHTCSCTRVRAFNARTRQSRAITRLGITPRRCSANSLERAHPRHCGELCDEAGLSSVTLCRPLLYG